MNIGIIGAGALGSSVARALARKQIAATISSHRGPALLASLVDELELGPFITAGTVQEAASADLVVIAVRWADTATALSGLPVWDGRIVIDATNPVEFLDPESPDAKDPNNPLAEYGIKAIDLGTKHSSEVLSELVPGARVVKAFNHLDASVLSEPQASGGKRVLFLAGDDAAARADVRQLIETTGFAAIDLGGLDVGGPLMQLPFGGLASSNFIVI